MAEPCRIVAVNRFYWPDQSATSQMLTDLAEHLAATGREVLVLTSRQCYDDPKARLARREAHNGVAIRRIRATRFGRARIRFRALDYASFHLRALLFLFRHLRANDLLLVKTDPPLLSLVAWLVTRLRGAAYTTWCQDLFPEIAEALGVGALRGRLGGALRRLRNRSLSAAATNVVLCETMARRLRDEGVPQERLTLIHNWADGALIRPVALRDNPLRAAWGLGERRVLGYAGNFGRVHDQAAVEAFLLAMARADPDLLFLFTGGGSGQARLRAFARAHGIAGLRQQPYQPRERLALALSVPDAHLVSLDPACEGLVMPCKLYAALAAGRPVVVFGAPAGGLARFVRRHDCGVLWRPGAQREVLALLERARDPAHIARIRALFAAEFDKPIALARWTATLEGAPLPVPLPAAEAKVA